MEDLNRPITVHVGFGNYILSEHIIAVLDAKMPESKRIVSEAKTSGQFVANCTKGRKSWTLLVLTGGRLIISSTPMKQLLKRMGAFPDYEDPPTLKDLNRSKQLRAKHKVITKAALKVISNHEADFDGIPKPEESLPSD